MNDTCNVSGSIPWPEGQAPYLAQVAQPPKDEYVYWGTCLLTQTERSGWIWSPQERSYDIRAAVYVNHAIYKAYVSFGGRSIWIDFNAITLSKKVVLL